MHLFRDGQRKLGVIKYSNDICINTMSPFKSILFSIFIFLFISQVCISQTNEDIPLDYEEICFSDSNYSQQTLNKAVKYFKTEIRNYPDSIELSYRLAVIYSKQGYHDLAFKAIGEKMENNDALPAYLIVFYIDELKKVGKYEIARMWEEKLVNDEAIQSNNMSNAKSAKLYKDSVFYEISNLNINSDKADFCPIIYKNGILFYSSRDLKLKQPVNFYGASKSELFWFDRNPAGFDTEVKKYKSPFDIQYYEGPFTFYNNYQNAFLSLFLSDEKNVYKIENKISGLRLYNVAMQGEPTVVRKADELNLNIFGFSFCHPTISKDGKTLYFVSNIPEGHGGTDIYRSVYEYGIWSTPENLGYAINSSNDEVFPYLLNDSILFFSSSKPGGLGKLDIYMVNLKTNKVENLGYPINSDGDDFSLIIDSTGQAGYFTSNRNTSRGAEDIYSFNLKRIKVEKTMAEYLFERNLLNAQLNMGNLPVYKGDMPDNDSLSVDSTIVAYEPSDEVEIDNYNIAQVKDISKALNHPVSKDIDPVVEKNPFNKIYRVQICAARKPVSEQSLKKKYNGDRPIYTFEEEGYYKYSIGDFDTYYDAKIVMKESKVQDAFIAAYDKEEKLVLMEAIKEQYGVFEEDKVLSVVTPHRMDSCTIYFDFDYIMLNDDAKAKLDVLASKLVENHSTKLAIYTHADYWGSEEYNFGLTEERGEKILEYLVNKGVDQSRMKIYGYGEYDMKEYKSKSTRVMARKAELLIYNDSDYGYSSW
ncbi:MAG: OmpA family protein [Bacteroidales bacterium]|nr:OmpA family protein [Bacteroidales bacterium]